MHTLLFGLAIYTVQQVINIIIESKLSQKMSGLSPQPHLMSPTPLI